MAKSKDDIKYGAAQAKLSEDETLRVAYKSGIPLEGGKIAHSEPVDLFSTAHKIGKQQQEQNKRVIEESEPVDQFSAAQGVANVNQVDESSVNRRQPSVN